MSGGIETTGAGLRRRALIGGGWYSIIMTLDGSGSTIVETIPDEPEPPHRTQAARVAIYARVAQAIEEGVDHAA